MRYEKSSGGLKHISLNVILYYTNTMKDVHFPTATAATTSTIPVKNILCLRDAHQMDERK